jgi:excisionase family DNA binding protein
MAQDWITTDEAAQLIGYTRRHVRRLVETGKVNGRRFGKVWQVSRSSLLAYLRRAEKLGEKRGPKSGA